jgi:hypothetical protein
MKTFSIFTTSIVMKIDKQQLHLPNYCLGFGKCISLYSRLLSSADISIQKLLSIAKRYSLSVYKENIPHVGNTYIICHDDMSVLQEAINELNSIVLLHELGDH